MNKPTAELQEEHLTFDLVIPSGHTWYCSKGSHSKNRKSIQKCKNILMFVVFCFLLDFKLVWCASGTNACVPEIDCAQSNQHACENRGLLSQHDGSVVVEPPVR